MAAYGVAHGFEIAIFGGERRVGGEIAFESERVRGVELAVEGGVEPEAAWIGIGVAHGSAFRTFASALRARARRDMTVPIGRPAASAMSR